MATTQRRGWREGGIRFRPAYSYTDKKGSVHHQPDAYLVTISMGFGAEGKRRRKYLYASTAAEARQKLRQAKEEQARRRLIAGRRVRLGDFLENWLATTAQKVRPSTFRIYDQLLRSHVIPALGHIPLDDLRPDDVRRMLANAKRDPRSRHAGPVSARTIHHIRAVLHNALSQAEDDGLISRTIISRNVRGPSIPEPVVGALDPEEAGRFLATVRDHPLGPLYMLAIWLGMRQGELLALRWQDLNLEVGVLTVRHTLQWRKVAERTKELGPWQLVEPKTAKSRRTLQLPEMVVAALREHLARKRRERVTAIDFVFTTNQGQRGKVPWPYGPRNIDRHFKATLKALCLPDIRFHDLRRTCASLYGAQGYEPRAIADLLGHRDTRTTLNLYTDSYAAKRQRGMVEGMAKILALPGPKASMSTP
jgi:integrase